MFEVEGVWAMAGVGQVGGLMSWEELEKLWEMEKLPEKEELS